MPATRILLLAIMLFFCGCGKIMTYPQKTYLSPLEEEEEESQADPFIKEGIEVFIPEKISPKKKLIDILFVVDTSYSMVKSLEQVNETFKGFINNLSSFNWKLGFINADYDPKFTYGRDLFMGRIIRLELRGQLLSQRAIYFDSQYREQIFLDTLKRYEPGDIVGIPSNKYINPCDLPPYCQGSTKNPIQSLMNALSINKSFFRYRSSAIVAIIFTNGDNMHNTQDTVTKFMSEFRKYHGSEKIIKIYSIVIPPGDEVCLNEAKSEQYNFASVEYGHQVHELVKMTEGKTISICTDNYAPLALVINEDILQLK